MVFITTPKPPSVGSCLSVGFLLINHPSLQFLLVETYMCTKMASEYVIIFNLFWQKKIKPIKRIESSPQQTNKQQKTGSFPAPRRSLPPTSIYLPQDLVGWNRVAKVCRGRTKRTTRSTLKMRVRRVKRSTRRIRRLLPAEEAIPLGGWMLMDVDGWIFIDGSIISIYIHQHPTSSTSINIHGFLRDFHGWNREKPLKLNWVVFWGSFF